MCVWLHPAVSGVIALRYLGELRLLEGYSTYHTCQDITHLIRHTLLSSVLEGSRAGKLLLG